MMPSVSDCVAPDGVVTGERRLEEDLDRSGRLLVVVPYPGAAEENHETVGLASVWADRLQLSSVAAAPACWAFVLSDI